MNPYESPSSTDEGKKINESSRLVTVIREYFSLSGSFSRTELLIATLVLGGLFLLRGELLSMAPKGMFSSVLVFFPFILYLLWGVAIGKRSRDLGTTFTYGMVVGMLFAILGIIFLFQDGAKFKANNRFSRSE